MAEETRKSLAKARKKEDESNEEREIQKDNIISLLTDKDKNNQYIIEQKDVQIGEYKGMTDDLKKELKGQRNKTFWYKVLSFVSLTTAVFFIK